MQNFENHLASADARDCSLLVLRLTAGGFLLWEVLDNIFSAARMQEFAVFLQNLGYPWPTLMAPLSVWFQALAGAALIAGWRTRSFATLLALHFLLAWLTAHLGQPLRAGWPALALVAIALVLATHGPGAWSLQAWRATRNQTES